MYRVAASVLLPQEAPRTNLALQSQLASGWTYTRASAGTAVAAPDGTTSAIKVTEDATATSTHTVGVNSPPTVTSGVTYAVSVFAKAAGRSWILVQGGGKLGSAFAYFNLSGSGAVGTTGGSPASTGIQALPNGWYRCWFTKAAGSSGSDGITVFLASADNTNTYSGDASSGADIWGVQYEASPFPTAYIATTSAAVTASHYLRRNEVP